MTVAVLFADPRGVYANLPGVDVWGEDRDARLYPGPWPVVAHPPCSRWCRLAGSVEARLGYKRGDDGGCFESALASVRHWGGVLEHPAYSAAWARYGLGRPERRGAWQRLACGGATCYVEQGRYGHLAKKATWLYAHGVDLPVLRWGYEADADSTRAVRWRSTEKSLRGDTRATMDQRTASASPLEFRDALLAIARTHEPPLKSALPRLDSGAGGAAG